MNAPLLKIIQEKISKMVLKSDVFYGDLNEIKDKTSFYYTSSSVTNKPSEANGANGYVFTQMVNEDVGYQSYKTTLAEFERFKNMTWGNWKEKKSTYITTGKEFVTGRIVDGKIEYGKRVNLGILPNTTSKSVAHGIANGFQVTHVEAWATNVNNVFGGIPLPYIVGTRYNELQITSTNVFISNNYDASAFNGYVTIYYTKK